MSKGKQKKEKNVREKIAVIGAGISGILSIASLKEEGFEPVCFEASDRYGGLWNYREESIDGFGSIMPTTVINHSKELGAFSTFPPNKEYSNHMHHRQLFKYITEFAKNKDCERHIRYNSEVVNLGKAEDYEETGRLKVSVKDRTSGEVLTDIFDGVMVATGHFTFLKMPDFPGMEKFKGDVIHTHSLKKVDKYKDKNVLVIGPGCSGLDAAEGTSSVAKQVYLSCRNGMFAINRDGPNGYPLDYVLMRRYLTFFLDNFPLRFCSWYLETFYLDRNFDHKLYYVKPKFHVLSKDPALNEAIFYKLLSGSVIQKGAVKEFTENGVIFEGEDTVTEIDSVIMGTGYTFKFPFLEEGLLQIVDGGRINLYKCVFPTHLPHPSLSFIGFSNPYGAGFPIDEMQSRWVTQIFAGKLKLPSNNHMLKSQIKFHRSNEKRLLPNIHLSVRIEYVSYLDDISSKMGCRPNLFKYFFTDPALYFTLVFGPSVPYQYRLKGPHKWRGAREAVMNAKDRIIWPLSREKRIQKSCCQSVMKCMGNIIPRNLFID